MFPRTLLHTCLLTVLALCSTAALAHAELTSSTPESGQTVNTAPSQVELVFSEGVEVSVSTFKVYPLPDDLAAAEAAAADDEAMAPLDDDDTSDDAASGDDDSNTGDDDGTSSDDHDDTSSDDGAEADQSDDHGLDSSSGVAAFVESVIRTEGDEAERVDTDVSSQGSEISMDLVSDLAPGWYVAMWSMLSDDGHPIEGYVTFNYQP